MIKNWLEFVKFMNNSLITRVQEDTFLGVIIHENLSWKPHIFVVCDKVSNVIRVLFKSRQYLPCYMAFEDFI